MFDPVGSTSWHNRHLTYFQKLDELMRQAALVDPTILVVGPGAVTQVASLFLNDAARSSGGARKLIGDAARYSDQLLRRIPFMPLTTLEPQELERAISVPHRLAIVDRSQRILRAVGRKLPRAACYCLDITRQPLPISADAIIAFNVICRLEHPEAGMAHVAKAVKPGGWLLIDDRSADAYLTKGGDFSEVQPKIHQRTEAAEI